MVVAGLIAGLFAGLIIAGFFWMVMSFLLGRRDTWGEGGSYTIIVAFWWLSMLATLALFIAFVVILGPVGVLLAGLIAGMVIFGLITVISAYFLGAYGAIAPAFSYIFSVFWFIIGILGAITFTVLLLIWL